MPAASASPARDITALPMHRRSALGLGALVPDHVAVSRSSPRSTTSRSRCRRTPGIRSASGAMPARKPELREPARAALARVGLGARADRAGRRAEPRRAPPARARDGARRQARACCCSTSRWPAWGRRNPRAWSRLLRALKQRADHPAGRARHGGGVRARRPHHGAGLWPRHRHRARRPRSAPTPDVRDAYLGEQEATAWLTPCSKSTGVETAYGRARCCSASRWRSRPARW